MLKYLYRENFLIEKNGKTSSLDAIFPQLLFRTVLITQEILDNSTKIKTQILH